MFPAGVRVGGVRPDSLVRISVGVDPSYAPFFVAEKEGLFEAAGLNLQIIQTEGGAASAQNVVAGTSEMSGNADSTALTVMAAQPDPARTRCLRGIRPLLPGGAPPRVTPQSIKTMGVFPGIGSTSRTPTCAVWALDPAAVKLVSTSPPEQPALLARGDIDGFISFDPWVAGRRHRGPRRRHQRRLRRPYSQWLLTSESWLAANEELAARGLRGGRRRGGDRELGSRPRGRGDLVGDPDGSRGGEAHGDQIDFVGRDFTPDDTARADDLVTFFRDQGKITGSVDTDTVMLHGWVSEHTDTE